MLQSNAMCNVSLSDLLNTVNKSGNVHIYVTFKYTRIDVRSKERDSNQHDHTFAVQKRIGP